jgi:hypothetical protein
VQSRAHSHESVPIRDGTPERRPPAWATRYRGPASGQIAREFRRLATLLLGWECRNAASLTYAPRGINFLLSANRLTVATSRARCACVVVGSPQLLEIESRAQRKMRLVNALCRFAGLAVVLDESAAEQTSW